MYKNRFKLPYPMDFSQYHQPTETCYVVGLVNQDTEMIEFINVSYEDKESVYQACFHLSNNLEGMDARAFEIKPIFNASTHDC